jgi:CheY-like chemotaxis protein
MPTTAAARILTVEDDPFVRADLRLILEDAGFVVCADARDGIEAIEHARAHRPDLVLIDLGLQRLDGVEATRQIVDEHDVPVVALSSRGSLAAEATAAGAVRHISKPFSEDELVATVSGVLAERAAEHDRYRVVIESMVREGRSEDEIVAAVGGRPATKRPFLRRRRASRR